MSAETNVRQDLGLIHAPLANVGNEIVHERTQDHPAREIVSASVCSKEERARTHVTGNISVRIKSEARPVTLGISTWLALNASR